MQYLYTLVSPIWNLFKETPSRVYFVDKWLKVICIGTMKDVKGEECLFANSNREAILQSADFLFPNKHTIVVTIDCDHWTKESLLRLNKFNIKSYFEKQYPYYKFEDLKILWWNDE